MKTNEEVRIASGRNRNLVWDLDDSPMGEGTIEASVKATDDHALVDLTMRWVGLHEQPECWEIQWCHHPDYIRDELPNYLRRFCPIPNEMIRALEQLGLEDFPTLEEEPPKPKQPARPPCMSRVNGQVAQSLLERIKAAQAKPEGEAND